MLTVVKPTKFKLVHYIYTHPKKNQKIKSSHKICDKNIPIDNFLQYILNPFCNAEKYKKIHKSFVEMSFLLILVSYLSSLFQNLLSFQPHKML